MNRLLLVFGLLLTVCCGFAQDAETARYEVTRWGKDQGCRFVSFGPTGGMMVAETDQTDDDKNRLWNFIALDSSLYELRSDLIPLPSKMKLLDAQGSARWAAFLFVSDKAGRSDSIPYCVVAYNRVERQFSTFTDRLPEKSVPLSMAMLDGTLMVPVNNKAGNGFLLHCDLDAHQQRAVWPDLQNDYVLFQCVADEREGVFVVAAREYVEKRYKATSFLVFSRAGMLSQRHRFENGENAALGRMCFDFDSDHHLTVYATLERENNKKVDVEGVTDDFNRTAVGVTWIKFSGVTLTRTYLFKDLPDIDQALTASDRLRVREEELKLRKGKKKEKGEVAFQFLTPRLTRYGDQAVFAAEAFQPVFHTETRFDYGFYGSYPRYYTVFDGYLFFSEILLAFDAEGGLSWHGSVRFENDLTETLTPHAAELVSHDELVVVSPSHHTLRYQVFDHDGTVLLDQQSTKLDFIYGADTFEDEYDAGVMPWFGDRFLVHGCQILQNGLLRVPRRTVFYLQKVKYE